MTQFLPPNLLALFAPREPIPFKGPVERLTHDKKRAPYTGIARYLVQFEDPKDTPAPVKAETRDERKERKRKQKAELQAYKIEQGIALWGPNNNRHATSDPYKTLFVGRINYETSESKLRREFEIFGPVKKIVLVHDAQNGKPRGYAFVEFEKERDMHAAYKAADGRKVDGRRVLVDVERGRTVKGWLPRRLGGGLGNTRRAREPVGEEGMETEPAKPASDRGGDRDRGRSSRDRDNRERDRDRESRGDRDRGGGGDRDRGDRRDRDRGDRDRERDGGRDRDRPPRDRTSRDRDRDRSDRGDRGDRRDRDRDRSDRGDRGDRRDRDRKDRDRLDRPIKEEKVDDGYNNANGNGAENKDDDN